MYLFGDPVELSIIATYSIGFLLFWLICSASSLLSWFMLPEDIKKNLSGRAENQTDLTS